MARKKTRPARTKRMTKKQTVKATKKVTKKPAKKPATKRVSKSAKRTSAQRSSSKKNGSVRDERRGLDVVASAGALQTRMMGARNRHMTIGFVPTMGALHSGHAALLEEARRRADVVVASIFVNPKQFGAGEDLAKYPRPIADDIAVCDAAGVDVLFMPSADEVYPHGFDTTVRAGSLAGLFEGAARPGHFDGVLTVVSILCQVVQPHFAIFGEKDFQQLTLVRRMVKDLRMPIEIVPMPVLRDVDGLALSSRNAYLAPTDRKKAPALYRALMAAQDEAQKGVVESERFVRAARSVLDEVEGAEVDYVEVLHPRTMARVDSLEDAGGEARLVMAVKLGGVRLLDNGPLFAGVRAAGVRYP
jgi:pantoate--beta-alanine ligase